MTQWWKLTYAMNQDGFLRGFLPIVNSLILVAVSLVVIFFLSVVLENMQYRKKGIGFLILVVAVIPTVFAGYHFIFRMGWDVLAGMFFADCVVALIVAFIWYRMNYSHNDRDEAASEQAVKACLLTGCFCLVFPLLLRFLF
jgi:hypothetical protein